MFFVHYLGTVNSYILFLMALDSITAWVVAHAGSLMMVIRAYPLPYCASNIINHCYCDHIGITILACTDRAPYGFPAFVFAMVTLLGPLAFIVFSYCCIIIAVLKIANVEGRIKSLSTCSTQLIIISLYYLPRCFVYLASNVGITFSADVRIGNQSTVTELSSLASLDFIQSTKTLFQHTTTLPKIIRSIGFIRDYSFTACFVQMFFVHYLGTVNSYILFLMALDSI
ncbi:hypothetical protein F7725_020530 [Dissostichus mawsoni]|uniref:G-protein coupled receptors family 1 profile domain-containing protein n=1 Tax=Dissostichus mawsoni TaxID=36200 RepID=A0A7J5YDH0_DISMA|nr:hypothetical protein F7725_020530 [Dissostichus mawsoni]